METHRQGTTLFTALAIVIGLIVIVQLWLLAAALDAFLGGETGVALPAAIASAVLFVLNGALLRFVWEFDARLRHRAGDD